MIMHSSTLHAFTGSPLLSHTKNAREEKGERRGEPGKYNVLLDVDTMYCAYNAETEESVETGGVRCECVS